MLLYSKFFLLTLSSYILTLATLPSKAKSKAFNLHQNSKQLSACYMLSVQMQFGSTRPHASPVAHQLFEYIS